jgi:diguanylate cyclase (GGDEF)-like protein
MQLTEINPQQDSLGEALEAIFEIQHTSDPQRRTEALSRHLVEIADASLSAVVIYEGQKSKPHSALNSIGYLTDYHKNSALRYLETLLAREKTSLIRINKKKLNSSSLPAALLELNYILCVPIQSDQIIFGWMCVASESNDFSAYERTLKAIANCAGSAYQSDMRNQQLGSASRVLGSEADIRKTAQSQLKLQFETAQFLASTDGFDKDFNELLMIIGKNLGFNAGRLWVAEPGSAVQRCETAWLEDETKRRAFVDLSLHMSMRLSQRSIDELVSFARPIWREDYKQDPNYPNYSPKQLATFEDYNLHTLVILPIVMRGYVIGMLTLMSTAVRKRNKDTLIVLEGITSQIGQYLERKNQNERILNLNRVHAMKSAVNNAVIHLQDREELLQSISNIAIDIGGFRFAFIVVLNPETGAPEVVKSHGSADLLEYTENLETALRTPTQTLRMFELMGKTEATISNRMQQDAEQGRKLPLVSAALVEGCNSGAALPLTLARGVEGLMVLYAAHPDFFDEKEVSLLNGLASDISFAMQYIKDRDKLNFLAYTDPVTTLPNRSELRNRLSTTIRSATELSHPFALMLANLNNFRDINDTLGYRNGDKLLKMVAERLQQVAFKSDLVANIGGDTFAVLLPRLANKEHITIALSKFRQVLEEHCNVSNIPVNVEVTWGVAVFPDHGSDADEIWRAAAVALREAKRLHRNETYYSQEIDHYDPKKLALIGQLRSAIENDELVLHYQPKLDVATQRTTGVEALIRWQHPEYGMIFPDMFIESAEQTDLINSITRWVLKKCISDLKDWHTQGFKLNLAANLSPRNLQDPTLVENIYNIVDTFDLSLDYLWLEITETAIMADPEHSIEVLDKLNKAGIQFSLDDFGIGQSSLTYLKNLPVSKMKIDKSFTMEIQDPKNASIVKSAVDLAHNMGIKVIAEGVEDEAAFELLTQYGCDQAQGYYFCKPLPKDELTKWLQESPFGMQRNA